MYVHCVLAGALKGQKGGVESLELALQVLTIRMWVLGTELESS